MKGKLTDKARHDIQGRMRAFFSRRQAAGGVFKKLKGTLKQRRLANRNHTMGLDHALQTGLGLSGLAAFACSAPVLALKAGETRYWVQVRDLPIEIQRCSPDRDRRSCIASGGQRRLEVNWSAPRPSLHINCDMGMIGWVSKAALYHSGVGALRGWWEADPAHRRHNNVLGAISRAGMSWCKLEVLLTNTLVSGPFDSAAFFGVVVEASEELFANMDFHCPLFQEHYRRISFEHHKGVLPVHFASEEHMQEMWAACREAWVFSKRGEKPKQGRWFKVFARAELQEPCWTMLLMVLQYIGLVEGWAVDMDDARLADGALDASRAAASTQGRGVKGQGGAEERPAGQEVAQRSVAESNAQVESLRKRCHNVLHVCMTIFSRPSVRALWLMVTRLTRPTQEAHGKALVMQKTKQGCSEWCIDMALGRYCSGLAATFEVFRDEHMLVEAGLLSQCVAGEGFVFSLDIAGPMVEATFEFVLHLVGSEILWCRRYNDMPPGLFMALLSDEHKEVSLRRLEGWWQALLEFEAEVLRDPSLRKFHSELTWAHASWVREIMTGLAEASWRKVPSDLREELLQVSRTFKSSKLAEDGFNLLRDRGRHHKAQRQSIGLRYANILTSALLSDADRPLPPVRSGSKAPEVPAEIFKSSCNEDFSLGDAFMEALMSDSDVTVSSAKYMQASCLWSAILQMRPYFQRLSRVWMSLLARPGDYIMKRAADGIVQCGLVVASTQFGAVVLRVELRPISASLSEICIATQGNELIYDQFCIWDPEEWEVFQVIPKPPAWAAAHGLSGDFSRGIFFTVNSAAPSKLLIASAYRGFQSLTVAQLGDMVTTFAISYAGRRPTLEAEVASLVIRHFLPDLSQEELLEVVNQRNLKSKQAGGQSILSSETAKVAADGLGDEELGTSLDSEVKAAELAKKVLRQNLAKVPPHLVGSVRRVSRTTGAGSSADLPSSQPQPVAPPLVRRSYALSEIRALLPKVRGCTITQHTGKAWLARYPGQPGDKLSLTVGFKKGDKDSIYDALVEVLTWVWTRHQSQPSYAGEQPPFDLGHTVT